MHCPSSSISLLQAPAPLAAAESLQPQEHVSLNLVTDKEWQRLFAVLTISGQPSRTGESEQGCGSSADAGSSASGTHSSALAVPASLEVAPATPARCETVPQVVPVAAEATTPTRKSFLLSEFTRVQAQLTPDRDLTSRPSSSCMEVMA